MIGPPLHIFWCEPWETATFLMEQPLIFIRGPCVNIPTTVKGTTQLLPRFPADAGMILLDLKRKLEYAGYYKSAYIRPSVVLRALVWLSEHNPAYSGIQSQFDEAMKLWMQQYPQIFAEEGKGVPKL